ncbi:GNAT family N-acetyltransferase [Amaricoccus macauensis]|uniref:GNAT family N-acetyltransferase n=1 Tax=Amaricoccus macauensis TaxID=57001 RepID=UPI003C7A9EB5
MRLRHASLEDIPMLRHWDVQPHVVASGAGGWEWEEMISTPVLWRELLIAEVEGQPKGLLHIIDPALEDTHYWGDCGPDLRALDIWIGEAKDTGRGMGTRMMQAALDRCFADPGVRAVLIDPQVTNTEAHRFYRRLGFDFIREQQFGEDRCFVFELTRATWRKGD